MNYIGLDIGGTKLMAAAADAEGKVLRVVRAATPPGLAAGLQTLDTMIADLSAGEAVLGMGAAIGGPLDRHTGVVSPLHQPGWREVPLGRRMRERWDCPFYVDVDTNVAAIGEYLASEPVPESLLYVTLSTGLGGGLIRGGEIFRGHGGSHPELGHQAINFRCAHPERVACECGAGDCLEALVSGNGIRRVYGKPAEQLTPGEWSEVGYNLGQGLRNAATLYAPSVMALGGGVSIGGGEGLLAAVRAQLAAGLRFGRVPEVRLSRHGYDTALQGAVSLAREAARFGYE